MQEMEILFGFDDVSFETQVKKLLASKGVEGKIAARFSKEGIKTYIDNHEDCNTVVLLESTGRALYTAEELAQFTDKRDINVIVVLSDKHLGTEYVQTLYTAGITGAIFQRPGKNGGAYPSDIATLILQRRTRAAARDYYGISSKIELGFLENSDFDLLYKELRDESKSTQLENYINICSRLSTKQIYDFTRRLPKDDKQYLAQFEEFHTVLALLMKIGLNLKIKKPKKMSIGLNTPVGIGARDDRIIIKKKKADTEGKNPDFTEKNQQLCPDKSKNKKNCKKQAKKPSWFKSIKYNRNEITNEEESKPPVNEEKVISNELEEFLNDQANDSKKTVKEGDKTKKETVINKESPKETDPEPRIDTVSLKEETEEIKDQKSDEALKKDLSATENKVRTSYANMFNSFHSSSKKVEKSKKTDDEKNEAEKKPIIDEHQKSLKELFSEVNNENLPDKEEKEVYDDTVLEGIWSVFSKVESKEIKNQKETIVSEEDVKSSLLNESISCDEENILEFANKSFEQPKKEPNTEKEEKGTISKNDDEMPGVYDDLLFEFDPEAEGITLKKSFRDRYLAPIAIIAIFLIVGFTVAFYLQVNGGPSGSLF